MRALRRVWTFLVEYKLFSLAIVAVLLGAVLALGGLHTAARWTVSALAILAALPLLRNMWRDLRSGTYGIDILAITAIVTSVILGEYWAAIVIVIMLTGGEALEDYAQHRAKSELDALLTRAPQRATVVRKQKTMEVPVKEVVINDSVLVKPGEVVPVDGIITEGSASFDESALTGESLPQSKRAGDELLSGTVNLDGAITLRCSRSAADSQYEQIIKLVRVASNSRAPFVRLADRYSIPFTVISYAIAITAWIVSGDPIRFLEVIVVATPCPLLLAAPIAIISGMSRAAKHGIIVKTGGALEQLAEVRTVAFDKTGTLTTGSLRVGRVSTQKPFDTAAVLSALASLEQHSNHILARAILNKARTAKLKLQKVHGLKEAAGQGLSGTIAGKPVRAGRLSFLEEDGVELSDKLRQQASALQTATFVAIDNRFAGYVTFEDTVRPESKRTVARLRALAVDQVAMVTGDRLSSARAIAKQVGISTKYIVAEALPSQKLHAVEKYSARPVAFVGDGVNDAPVLTAADVGIALGARGSTAASESADMVIMLDDVSRVATAVEIAKRTFQIASQSIFIGIGLSVALMVIFSFGTFSALTGAIVQEAVDIVVILNALRAHGSFGPLRSVN